MQQTTLRRRLAGGKLHQDLQAGVRGAYLREEVPVWEYISRTLRVFHHKDTKSTKDHKVITAVYIVVSCIEAAFPVSRLTILFRME